MEVIKFTEDQLEENKVKFIDLLREIQRPGCKTEELIAFLEKNDFFTMAASTKYHNCVSGGLCDHSLVVYENMVMLNASKSLGIDSDTLLICGLLHDISKVYMYKLDVRNKKVYYEGAPKHDSLGSFEWISQMGWVTTDPEDRPFAYGNHEETSEFILRSYIPLKWEESAAIINHHGGMNYDSAQVSPSQVLGRNTIAAALHIADSMAAFLEKR